MKKIKRFVHIIKFIFNWKIKGDITKKFNENSAKNVLKNFFNIKHKLNETTPKFIRNREAEILRQLRKKYPYEVIDYSESKELYNQYEKISNKINSFDELIKKSKKDEIYLYKFTNQCGYKGEKFESYFTFSTYFNKNYEVYLISEFKDIGHNKYFNLDSCKDSWKEYINESNYRCFVYATKDQIEDFKKRKKMISHLNDEINKRKKEISEFNEKINKIADKEY